MKEKIGARYPILGLLVMLLMSLFASYLGFDLQHPASLIWKIK